MRLATGPSPASAGSCSTRCGAPTAHSASGGRVRRPPAAHRCRRRCDARRTAPLRGAAAGAARHGGRADLVLSRRVGDPRIHRGSLTAALAGRYRALRRKARRTHRRGGVRQLHPAERIGHQLGLDGGRRCHRRRAAAPRLSADPGPHDRGDGRLRGPHSPRRAGAVRRSGGALRGRGIEREARDPRPALPGGHRRRRPRPRAQPVPERQSLAAHRGVARLRGCGAARDPGAACLSAAATGGGADRAAADHRDGARARPARSAAPSRRAARRR